MKFNEKLANAVFLAQCTAVPLFLISVTVALAAKQQDPPPQLEADCTDPATQRAFTLHSERIYGRVTVIGGENYGFYDIPDGRTLRLTDSVVDLICGPLREVS